MKLSIPGEFAAIVEEIAPGENTFEENGEIFASAIGLPVIDKEKRCLKINAFKPLRQLKRGDIVTAEVIELYDQIAQVQILEVEGTGRVALASKSAFIRISELQKGFVDFLRDHIRAGDYLRAKVIDVTDLGTYITIVFPEYGVIKALCSHCRSIMKQNGSTFTCPECASVEQRKTPMVNAPIKTTREANDNSY